MSFIGPTTLEFIRGITSRDPKTRAYYARTIVYNVEYRSDLNYLVAPLAWALADLDSAVRKDVCWALLCMVDTKTDVSAAIPALTTALQDECRNVREYTASILTKQYLHTANWDAIMDLLHTLRNGPIELLHRAIPWIAHFASSGNDVTPIVDCISHLLSDSDVQIKLGVADVLVEHHLTRIDPNALLQLARHADNHVCHGVAIGLEFASKNRDISAGLPALFFLFTSDDPDIQKYVQLAFVRFVENNVVSTLDSMEKIEQLNSQLEKWFSEFCARAQGTERSRRDVLLPAARMAFSVAQMKLADRKAELARQNDGELLTGETTKAPAARKGLYQSIRIRDRILRR